MTINLKSVVLFALLTACATVDPILKPIEQCAGQSVSLADVVRARNDLETQNYADLAILAVTVGYPVVVCIVDAETAKSPELKPAGEEFKRAHAVEIRNAEAR